MSIGKGSKIGFDLYERNPQFFSNAPNGVSNGAKQWKIVEKNVKTLDKDQMGNLSTMAKKRIEGIDSAGKKRPDPASGLHVTDVRGGDIDGNPV